MKRIGWFLLVLGISLGTIFGLYYAWEIGPLDPEDALPSDLQEQYQEELITLIAIAYANTGDLNRAVRRLELIPHPGDAQFLNALAQQHLADGRPEEDVRSMAQLAAALATQEADPSTPPPSSRTTTPTNSPTLPPTSTPTPTYTPTLIPDYQLRSQEEICNPDLNNPLIQVQIFDSLGIPIPGVEVKINWDAGEDHFFTGLKPEIGFGYGDFRMTENVTYSLQVTGIGDSATGLSTVECLDEEDISYLGSWLLIFDKP
jgi:hypothetical protein